MTRISENYSIFLWNYRDSSSLQYVVSMPRRRRMFVRVKKVGPYQYLQIAQNRREGKRVKQSIIATLGRLDKLTASGAIDQLLRSAARFAERLMVLDRALLRCTRFARRHRRLHRPSTDLRTPVA